MGTQIETLPPETIRRQPISATSLTRLDYVLALLVAFAGLIGILGTNLHARPFEDAAMIMRYAEHVAHGYGMVWNIGEAPIDGATDFLFTVVVAGLIKLGLTAEAAILVLDLLAHLLTTALIFACARIQGAVRILSFAAALAVGLGPAWHYVAFSFGTPFFAMWGVLAWFFAVRMLLADHCSQSDSAMFALSCLLLGLTRPEGCLFATFMLAAVVWRKGLGNVLPAIAWFAGMFLIVGGGYFVWRWLYFGHPLPNPFYVKGGHGLHPKSVAVGSVWLCSVGWPFLTMVLFARRSKAAWDRIKLLCVVAVPYMSMWILLSNDMNLYGRFQYAILPLVAITWALVVSSAVDQVKKPMRWTIAMAVLVVATAALLLVIQAPIGPREDGRYDVAMRLRTFGPNHTIATTEAGLLPEYSQWRAVDTWGLNDAWIAHHGVISTEYLDRYRPDVVLLRAVTRRTNARQSEDKARAERWIRMVDTVHSYVHANHYILAASYGPDCDNKHLYYVRRDSPIRDALLAQFTGISGYAWFGMSGEQTLANNYTRRDRALEETSDGVPSCSQPVQR